MDESDKRINTLKELRAELLKMGREIHSNGTTKVILMFLVVFVALSAATATVVYLELHVRPKQAWIEANLLLVFLVLVQASLVSYQVSKGVLALWRARVDPQLEVEKQMNVEQSLAQRVVGSQILKNSEIECRLQLQASIYGIRNVRLPNWVTASSALLAIPITIFLTIWFDQDVKSSTKVAYLEGHNRSLAYCVTFLGTIVIASLAQTDRLVKEQELCVRLHSIIKEARELSLSRGSK